MVGLVVYLGTAVVTEVSAVVCLSVQVQGSYDSELTQLQDSFQARIVHLLSDTVMALPTLSPYSSHHYSGSSSNGRQFTTDLVVYRK